MVWFVDGNRRTYYSLDWKNRYSKARDVNLGMRRLLKLVTKYGEKASVIEIYDIASNKLLKRYERGIKRDME